MQTLILEIHAAEGGADSQLLTQDLARAYERFFVRKGWKHRVVRERRSDIGCFQIDLEVTAQDLSGLTNETGGHRFQRIPPTERRGRVHTSTVTVAVLNQNIASNAQYEKRSDDDFRTEWFQSLGAGGQNANKHHNCCRLIHKPTGLKQEAKGKSRESNFRQAKQALIKVLDEKLRDERAGKLSDSRKAQVGSGMRGDKVRTIRAQDNTAKDHQTGKACPADKLMAGHFDLLW